MQSVGLKRVPRLRGWTAQRCERYSTHGVPPTPRSRARAALPFVLLALAFFALCLLAAARMQPPERPPAAAQAPVDAGDAGPPEPRILIDPDSIQLLPDASLEIHLPRGFEDDAGSADGTGPR